MYLFCSDMCILELFCDAQTIQKALESGTQLDSTDMLINDDRIIMEDLEPIKQHLMKKAWTLLHQEGKLQSRTIKRNVHSTVLQSCTGSKCGNATNAVLQQWKIWLCVIGVKSGSIGKCISNHNCCLTDLLLGFAM